MVGKGSAWLVSGESGVGKSRLLEELRTQALVGGAMVLRGQAVTDAGSPYTVWQSVVRRLILQTTLDDLEVGVLQALVPDIGQLLERTVIPVPVLNTQATQTRLLSTISTLFQRQNAAPCCAARRFAMGGRRKPGTPNLVESSGTEPTTTDCRQLSG